MSEYENGHWKPFVADDIQFEMVMMHPFVRKTLAQYSSCSELPLSSQGCPLNEERNKENAHYHASCRLADRTGVFTIRLAYRRPGYTFVDESQTVIVRHYAHNETPRLLAVAIPYYVVMLSMMAGAVLLMVVFLYYKRPETNKIKSN